MRMTVLALSVFARRNKLDRERTRLSVCSKNQRAEACSMDRATILCLAVVINMLLAAAASAQSAFTTRTANLRAGPSRVFPLVRRLSRGAPVAVVGCVNDLTWCDVSVGRERGWVYARNLQSPFQGRPVVIYGSGPRLGFPIITFSLGSYWDTFYRGRPWYSTRSYWMSRPPPPRRPPWGPPPPSRHARPRTHLRPRTHAR